MRTNEMIYQVASAHQAELRRAASTRASRDGRDTGRTAQNRLLSLIGAQHRRARAALRPTANGPALRRASV